ncbi:MAG TPA: hypothetical protein VFJ51_13240 [Nitrososphaeraceae archaeon]|nr:hypothetical protein [Nitrososphaeraceae archaeon]
MSKTTSSEQDRLLILIANLLVFHVLLYLRIFGNKSSCMNDQSSVHKGVESPRLVSLSVCRSNTSLRHGTFSSVPYFNVGKVMRARC